jgi:O-antigen/teichoic acid export membrane protein/SAM-dependent methyltransferase
MDNALSDTAALSTTGNGEEIVDGRRAPIDRLRLMWDMVANYSAVLLSGALGFITVPFLLRGLGTDVYGVWIAALAFSGIVGAFDFGLEWALTREVAAASGSGDRSRAAPFVRSAAMLYLAVGTAGGLLVAIAGRPLSQRLGIGSSGRELAPAIFWLAGVSLFCSQVSRWGNGVLEGMRRFDLTNTLVVVSSLLRTAGTVALVIGGARLLSIAIWYSGVSVLSAIGTLIVVIGLEPCFRSGPMMKLNEIGAHLGFGVASQTNALLTKVIWESAPVVVAGVAGPAAVVALHIGQRFPMALSLIADRTAGVLFPAASELAPASETQREAILLRSGLRAVLAVALPACSVMWVVAPALLRAWIPGIGADTIIVARICTLAVFVDALAGPAVQVLWGKGKVARLAAVSAGAAAVVLTLTVVLAHTYSAIGAAVAFLVAVAIGMAVNLRAECRDTNISVRSLFGDVARTLILPTVGAAAVAAVLVRALTGRWAPVIAAGLAAALVYATAFYFFAADNDEREFLNRLVPVVKILKRLPGLRSAVHLSRALAEWARDPWEDPRRFDRLFSVSQDPWNLRGKDERCRFDSALSMLAKAAPHGVQEAFEIGCAEGTFTAMLQPHCRRIYAVDVSPVALQRVSMNPEIDGCVTLGHWDLRKSSVPGSFDLVAAMCVLEYLRRRSDYRKAREKLVASVKPGGYLLLSHARQSRWHESFWGRLLLRDALWINDFMSAHPALQVLETQAGAGYLNCLLRRVERA